MRRIQTEALEALDGPCTFSVAALAESELLARALARLRCSCLSQNFDDGLLDSEQREDERASERSLASECHRATREKTSSEMNEREKGQRNG